MSADECLSLRRFFSFVLGCSVGIATQLLPPSAVSASDRCFPGIPSPDCGLLLAQAADDIPEWTAYNEYLEALIDSAWKDIPNETPGRTVVSFIIQRDGSLSQLLVQESSGNVAFDSLITDALRAIAPFRSFPEAAPYDSYTLTYTFEIQPSEPAEIDREYLDQIQLAIAEQWSPSATEEIGRVTLSFDIGRDGAVRNLSIAESSGNSALDQDALTAVDRAAPFSPLPDSYPADVLPYIYTLNSDGVGNTTQLVEDSPYPCLELGEFELGGLNRVDIGNSDNERMLLRGSITNHCEVGFESAAWRVHLFPASNPNYTLGVKTEVVEHLLPGETADLTFFIAFGELQWNETYAPRRIISEGFGYTIEAATFVPMD